MAMGACTHRNDKTIDFISQTLNGLKVSAEGKFHRHERKVCDSVVTKRHRLWGCQLTHKSTCTHLCGVEEIVYGRRDWNPEERYQC